MTDTVAAVVATLVGLAFALSTFERYLARRARHELAWSLALAFFAVASGALALGATVGWTGATFRVFYLFGAVVNVPVLALGTVYLLAGRRVGDVAAACVALGAAFSAGALVSLPYTGTVPRHVLAQGAHVLPPLAQVLAGVGSGAGTIVIVAGAIYSALRRRRSGRVALGNVIIAFGTLVTGASGIANSVFDKMTAFAVALGAGISIIFVGFIVVASAGAARLRTGAREPGAATTAPQPASVNRSAR